ncbi:MULTISPECIES: alpha-amylase family glycosyl hydrolase [unclassified Spirosoma]|uniref:alpha-amylase family glycosyl hydrolase n=1 Tax=unclassified Spirosoma TaxID=2621999 RepID=UPI000962AC98|nr:MULTISPECIES: alpha-amylase family glycosyl hydrolase [unclassified Spirosoma]MBN8824869.1 alpha amylase C-terminal domain-containing protein [Spirosoma sp.]OJW74803.1 MAG: alpha-amylase [Spirosoma sp. 48-14]
MSYSCLSTSSPTLSRRDFAAGLLAAGILSHPAVEAADALLNPTAKPSDKLVIYQIFTRLFGNQKTANKPWGSRDENGVGKFNDITAKALQELKNFGISHVWYTGVIEHAVMTDYSANGIQRDNPLVVKGRAGSPYAIKDYYDVNPDLAVDVNNRMAEFEALLKRSHAAGLKVIIDFVPNHVARQYHSDAKPAGVQDLGQGDDTAKAFSPNNNFYYLPGESFQVPDGVSIPDGLSIGPYVENPAKATGNDAFKAKPGIDDWYETVKLNYGVDYANNRQTHFDPVPSTWVKMRDILLFWAKKGVDGFRCDMAEMVPVEFWGWAIPQVKATRPGLIFIAEIYNPQQYKAYIQQGKFDYLYDKVGLYDALRRLMEGKGTAEDITKVWQNESGDISEHMMRFLENHDEQRIASRFFAGDPWVALPAMTLSATLHTGPTMLYFGQELGVNPTKAEGFQGDDGRTTIFDYWGIPEYQAWVNKGAFDGGQLTPNQRKLRQFYQQLIQLVNTSDAIRTGSFYDLQASNKNGQSSGYDGNRLYSYLRYSGRQKLLIICNFDKQEPVNTTVQIPTEAWKAMNLSGSQTHVFQDIFRTKTRIAARNSVPVTLPPLGVLVLEIK